MNVGTKGHEVGPDDVDCSCATCTEARDYWTTLDWALDNATGGTALTSSELPPARIVRRSFLQRLFRR